MSMLKVQSLFDEPVTAAVMDKAIERGRKRRVSEVHATAVHYLPVYKSLLICLADQSAVTLPVKNYPELSSLSENDLFNLSLGFGGSALCLAERDLHVSIVGLVSASESLVEMAAIVIAVRKTRLGSEPTGRTSRDNNVRNGGRLSKLVVG